MEAKSTNKKDLANLSKRMILIPDQANGKQSTAGGSHPKDPVMVPVVGGHCRTKCPCRVHARSRQKAPEAQTGMDQKSGTASQDIM